MMKKTLSLLVLMVSLLPFCFSPPLSAGRAGIRDLLVTNNANHVLVYARVMNCFTKDIEAAILAGVPTTFTFVVDLFRQRPWWRDKKVSRVIVKHTIKYDNVKNLFQVRLEGDKEPMSLSDFEGAKRMMADLNGVPVAPLKALKRNEYYYIRVKAKLDKVRLPLHMEYLFFFVSFWDFETNWEREGFFY